MFKSLLALAAMSAVAVGANANVDGGVAANQNPTSFVALSAANVTGGALYTLNALPNAAIPMNTAPPKTTVGTWLAASPDNVNNGGGDAIFTLSGAGSSFVSFLNFVLVWLGVNFGKKATLLELLVQEWMPLWFAAT